MPRFFIGNSLDPAAVSLVLGGADFHHIRDVLRLRPGDELEICDGARGDLRCRISRFLPEGVELAIEERRINPAEPPYQAILYQGLAKGDKMETIIQKTVELGVYRIVPVQCRRSVARLDLDSQKRKLVRWNRIAAEAAKQCGRGILPEVSPPLDFAAALAEAARADIRLIPWEGEHCQSLRQELESFINWPAGDEPAKGDAASMEPVRGDAADSQSHHPAISLLIGPEGGFAPEEIDLAVKAGIRPVTLGRRILRTETAGAAVLAILIYRFNDF